MVIEYYLFVNNLRRVFCAHFSDARRGIAYFCFGIMPAPITPKGMKRQVKRQIDVLPAPFHAKIVF
jgi:hypothetical protein